MKVFIKIAIITVVIFTSATLRGAEGLPDVESVFSEAVRFEGVKIENLDGRFILTGMIKRSVYNSHLAPGHIDYIVVGGNGEILAEGAVTYTPSLSLRRWKYGSSFSVLLPESVTKDASVKVIFHKNKGVTEKYSRPVLHDSNLLINEE